MAELSRRDFLLLILMALASAAPGASAWAKGSGSSGSGSNSGSGSSGSGSGSGSGSNSGSGGGDDGDDDDDNDDDDNSGKGRRKDQDDILDAVKKGKVISLEKAMKSLQGRYAGRVIDAKLRGSGEDLVYSFKLKSADGKVRRVEMDARTGRLLNFLGF